MAAPNYLKCRKILSPMEIEIARPAISIISECGKDEDISCGTKEHLDGLTRGEGRQKMKEAATSHWRTISL